MNYLDNTGSSYMNYLDGKEICKGDLCNKLKKRDNINKENDKCDNINKNLILDYDSHKCKKIPSIVKNQTLDTILYDNDNCRVIDECEFCSEKNDCGTFYNYCDKKTYSNIHLCKTNPQKESNIKKCSNQCDKNDNCNSFEVINYKNKCKLYTKGDINNIEDINDNFNISSYLIKPHDFEEYECQINDNNNCISNNTIVYTPNQIDNTLYNLSLDECKKECEFNDNCYSVQYYDSKSKCNLYNINYEIDVQDENNCNNNDYALNDFNNNQYINENNLLDICDFNNNDAPIYISYLQKNNNNDIITEENDEQTEILEENKDCIIESFNNNNTNNNLYKIFIISLIILIILFVIKKMK